MTEVTNDRRINL